MAFSYLTTKNVFEKYDSAKKHTNELTEPFPEFNRVRENKPRADIPKKYPDTTDGTTASVLRKSPRRIIQQLPTGRVESNDDSWLSVVADFVYREEILKGANTDYDLLQKAWNTVEDGLTFGSKAVYTPFVSNDGGFTSDYTTVYWGDIFLPKGYKSGYSAPYVFMRSWWQKDDVDQLIKDIKQEQKQAKKNGEKYEGLWDIAALEDVKKACVDKDEQGKQPHEEDRNINPNGIEIITGLQDGINAEIITFNPVIKKPLRTKKNRDPRGKKPIDWFYADIDGQNPLGRGIVDLVGPLQNLIDADMQMYQYNRAYNLQPTLKVIGNVNSPRLEPNKILKIQQGGDVIPITIDTAAIANYPALYGLQKSQLLNLVSSPDTSISSEIGNPGFSKTPAGVRMTQASISVDDNYVRKMFEKFWENWSETAINVWFAERTGVEELQLDDEAADRLRKLADEGKFDITLLSEDNLVTIDYETATPVLKFKVDASTSKVKDDTEQLQALTTLVEALDGSPVLQAIVTDDMRANLWNAIVTVSGAENVGEFKVEDEQLNALKESRNQQNPEKELELQKMQAELEKEQLQVQVAQIKLETEQVKAQGAVQDQAIDQQELMVDEDIAGLLRSLGADDTTINYALQQASSGVPANQILQEIGVVNA